MEETPFEAVASICSVLVVGLFILTFLAQNFVIPSGSMEKTLLVGDHLVVDRITLAPPAKWMPLVHYREPKRGDIVVFLKPVPDLVNGKPEYLILVKRLIGVPGDHIHLRNGIVILNGVAQDQPHAANRRRRRTIRNFSTSFPPCRPYAGPWRHRSLGRRLSQSHRERRPGGPARQVLHDGRQPAQQPRFALLGICAPGEIVGRPLFNYWSFETPEDQYEQTGIGNTLAWMGHVALHFFTETRWKRTLHLVR